MNISVECFSNDVKFLTLPRSHICKYIGKEHPSCHADWIHRTQQRSSKCISIWTVRLTLLTINLGHRGPHRVASRKSRFFTYTKTGSQFTSQKSRSESSHHRRTSKTQRKVRGLIQRCWIPLVTKKVGGCRLDSLCCDKLGMETSDMVFWATVGFVDPVRPAVWKWWEVSRDVQSAIMDLRILLLRATAWPCGAMTPQFLKRPIWAHAQAPQIDPPEVIIVWST